jgi:glutamate racemase
MPLALPIGVFDSGVGGVSVLREIRRTLPHENVIYVADSRHAPYGDRPPAHVTARATTVIEYFVERGAKAVVVACNTATGIAVDTLRATFPALPIVAIEPALKPAAARTASGVVGILATSGTLASEKFRRLVDTHGQRVTVIAEAGVGLVEQVERGALNGSDTRALVERYVRPMIAGGADTIVLGCTHYPFLAPVIQDVAGPSVAVIDPAVAVARELVRRLELADSLSSSATPGAIEFLTSGNPDDVSRVLAALWQEPVKVERLPERFS